MSLPELTITSRSNELYPFKCTLSGSIKEGKLGISSDRSTIGLACYDSALVDSDPSVTTAADVHRVSVFIDYTGNITNYIVWTDTYSSVVSRAVLS